MFNPQILAASWVEKMVGLHPFSIAVWVSEPARYPKLTIVKELDHFIEGTMLGMEGRDKTNPDLWGQTMELVLTERFGPPVELDQRELNLPDRMYLQTLREFLNGMVEFYFEEDWEKEEEQRVE